MKTLKILIIMIFALSIIACNSRKNPDIVGTYITSYQNEYTEGNDTLVITSYNADGGVYEVSKRMGYQRIREGKKLPREFKTVKWMATYEKESQGLSESEFGRKIFLAPDRTALKFGNTAYRRIK
jgi:hypothetical protein